MKRSSWKRADRLMRSVHLYTGMFLVPWMAVYAASGLCLNHGTWFTETFKIASQEWKTLRQLDFHPGDGFPRDPDEQARALLGYVDLDGAHVIQGTPNPTRMVVIRFCSGGHYRVTWQRDRARLQVERRTPFSYYQLLHSLHFQHGYHADYPAHLLWGIIVDAVTISTLLWVITGIYIWARRPRRRLAGGICLAAGSMLFAALAVLLCR